MPMHGCLLLPRLHSAPLQLPIHKRHPIDLVRRPPREPDNPPPALRSPGHAVAALRPGRHRPPRTRRNLHVEDARVAAVRGLAEGRGCEALAGVQLERRCGAAGAAVGEGLAGGEGEGEAVEAGGAAERDGGGFGGRDAGELRGLRQRRPGWGEKGLRTAERSL
jgi:hypothetical protein